MKSEPPDLHDPTAAAAFYEERYARGYMDMWAREKMERIGEVIGELDLPATGTALDFGCGNGVLTDVLRQALPPGWTVFGTDISVAALENARRRYPACTFVTADRAAADGLTFDLLFSHHVLEHVHDLDTTLSQIDALLKPDSAVLHIMPCGNAGSFEHTVCALRTDGIDVALEQRFFEDEGHLRRLDTATLEAHYVDRGFTLARELYANHHYGAIDWITREGPGFVRRFTDTSTAVDATARRELARVRRRILILWATRFPASFVDSRLRQTRRSARDLMHIALGLPFYVFTKPMDILLKRRAAAEWRERRTDRQGSEMYLFFRRQSR
jgi:SAM-dependent methyltransferase